MKGPGMPGKRARIKRKPVRCQWKVASLPFLVPKATPEKVAQAAWAPAARSVLQGLQSVPRVGQVGHAALGRAR
eukprot:Skav208913  [mRNA]  locus=scaffold787:3259:3877:- [translate_table: standard]